MLFEENKYSCHKSLNSLSMDQETLTLVCCAAESLKSIIVKIYFIIGESRFYFQSSWESSYRVAENMEKSCSPHTHTHLKDYIQQTNLVININAAQSDARECKCEGLAFTRTIYSVDKYIRRTVSDRNKNLSTPNRPANSVNSVDHKPVGKSYCL